MAIPDPFSGSARACATTGTSTPNSIPVTGVGTLVMLDDGSFTFTPAPIEVMDVVRPIAEHPAGR